MTNQLEHTGATFTEGVYLNIMERHMVEIEALRAAIAEKDAALVTAQHTADVWQAENKLSCERIKELEETIRGVCETEDENVKLAASNARIAELEGALMRADADAEILFSHANSEDNHSRKCRHIRDDSAACSCGLQDDLDAHIKRVDQPVRGCTG